MRLEAVRAHHDIPLAALIIGRCSIAESVVSSVQGTRRYMIPILPRVMC
jgi:uncharacterized membrane protein